MTTNIAKPPRTPTARGITRGTCERCGATFVASKRARFCSRRCSAASWRARHPDYQAEYYRGHRAESKVYAERSRMHLVGKPCTVEGCDEPRHVYPSGVGSRCRRHLQEVNRARRASLIPYVPRDIPLRARPCLGPVSELTWANWDQEPVRPKSTCPNPRVVMLNGAVDGRCIGHTLSVGRDPAARAAELGIAYDDVRRAVDEQGGACWACSRRSYRDGWGVVDGHWLCRPCYRAASLLRSLREHPAGEVAALSEILRSGRARINDPAFWGAV